MFNDCTPLHTASRKGHLDCVIYLLESGADIDAKAVNDCTPLHVASQNGHLECVKYFIERGANKNIKANGIFGKTAIEIALKMDIFRL
jgi:ankyrin repeat protein